MNKFLVLFSVIFAISVAYLNPEHAADQFIKSFIKHVNGKDSKIVDKDFYVEYKSGKKVSRAEFIAQTFGPNSQNARPQKDYPKHVDSFNKDGLLEMKFYNGSVLDSYTLAKSDENIEGGYKLYRIVVVV